MTAAHGLPRRRARGERLSRAIAGLQVAGMLGFLLMVVSIPAREVYGTWAAHRAEVEAWTISGPPCPVVAAPSPRAKGKRPPKTFSYRGVTFERQHGHVSCVALPEPAGTMERRHYPVCQFNAPSYVAVTVSGRTTVFEPGPVRPATITVRDGEPACVLAGWFRY